MDGAEAGSRRLRKGMFSTPNQIITHNNFFGKQNICFIRWPTAPRSVKKDPMQPLRPKIKSPPMRSESTEDHLERIQDLVDRKGYARVSDIAASLALSPSAVSNMVRRLAARGFVNYEKYRGFTLTDQGRAVAKHIRARHETFSQLLQLLGLGPETVEQETEAVEHHLRPETLQVFSKLVAFWHSHPAQLQEFLQYSRRAPSHAKAPDRQKPPS